MTHAEVVEKIKGRFGGRCADYEERSKKRVYFTIDAKEIREVTVFLHQELGCRFNIASAIDSNDAFEIIYHFTKDEAGVVINVRVFLKDKANPRIDSVTPQMKGAEWIEREICELFGIKFDGHPNPVPLLLPDDWPAGVYPLRKDFVPPKRDDRTQEA